jgi:hypothetical protein
VPEKGPIPIQKSRLSSVRRPKRIRNLFIAALIGGGLAYAGWTSHHWSWAIIGAVVFVLALVNTWFSRKLGVLVVGILRVLVFSGIRLLTALVFYGIVSPISLLSRLRPRPWRASEQVLADPEDTHDQDLQAQVYGVEEDASSPSGESQPDGASSHKSAAATLSDLLRPKGEPSYAAPPRRPPTAADFERLR